MKDDLYNIDAERSVIGSILIEPDSVYKVLSNLNTGDFYNNAHQLIYHTLSEMAQNSDSIDSVTLTSKLIQSKRLQSVGGAAYLSQLSSIPSAASIEKHAEIIKTYSDYRRLITDAKNMIEQAQTQQASPDEIMSDFLSKSISKRNIQRTYHIQDVLKKMLINIEKTKAEGIRGITTGLIDLDRRMGGFINGELTILAGRPSMGKSALGFQMALDIAKNNIPVGIISLEMPDESITGRYISAATGIENRLLMQGAFPKEKWTDILNKSGDISKLPLFIHDEGSMSLSSVIATIQAQVTKYNTQIVFIDYLQLIKFAGRSKNEEVGEVSQALKGLAKRLNIPIVALAQLSRALEMRNDKRPILSDLRDSGSLEQDADIVLFVYREFVYSKNDEVKNLSEIILAKGRNIGTGAVKLFFNDKTTSFSCLVEY